MADDLVESLEDYKIQLQQVETALAASPENAELKKLKVDLLEVINLTMEVIGANKASSSNGSGNNTKNNKSRGVEIEDIGEDLEADGGGVIRTIKITKKDPAKVMDKVRKSQFQLDREKKRKKAVKRLEKLEQLDHMKEKEKNKWKAFTTKAQSKSLRGVKKDSIFASGHSSQSRVGVGTCGQPDKPTELKQSLQPKYQRGAFGYR